MEASRFSCLWFLGVPGVSDYRRFALASRWRPSRCCLPLSLIRSASPSIFSKLHTRPTSAPVYASTVTSRYPPQNSGSGWFATPFL